MQRLSRYVASLRLYRTEAPHPSSDWRSPHMPVPILLAKYPSMYPIKKPSESAIPSDIPKRFDTGCDSGQTGTRSAEACRRPAALPRCSCADNVDTFSDSPACRSQPSKDKEMTATERTPER